MKKIMRGFRLPRRGPFLRGDTILEVVISTAILSTLMISTFDILQRALDINVNVKNRVIALNIAREGMEGVRNVRDTNWLRYSGERRDKWLCLDVAGASPPTCTGSIPDTLIINENDPDTPTYYTIDFDTAAGRFFLTRAALQDQIDFELAQTGVENYRLFLTPLIPQRYTHTTGVGFVETPFYRQIWLDIENPYDSLNATMQPLCGTGDLDDSCRKARLDVVVRVFWQEEGRTRSVTLEGSLFDFFERDAY